MKSTDAKKSSASADASDAGAFFHGFADAFDTFYDGKRSVIMQWVDRRFRSDMFARYELTFERLGNLEGRRGLDIGCGSGPYVVEALRRGAEHVIALDPAPRMLELTRQRAERHGMAHKITLIEGYFPNKLPEGKVDFAIVMGVLDYVHDPVPFLKGLKQVVTDKSVISFPSNHWLRAPLRKIRYRLRHCPVYFYTEDRIRSLARQSGFSEVDVRKIPGAGMDYHVCLRS